MTDIKTQVESHPQQLAANLAYDLKTSFQKNPSPENRIHQRDIFHQMDRGFHDSKSDEFAVSLAKELGLDKLIHTEKDGKTKYFEIQSPEFMKVVDLCESLAKRTYANIETTSESFYASRVLFDSIIFGLKDTEDVSLIMSNILKAPNLPNLRQNWEDLKVSYLGDASMKPHRQERYEWAKQTFIPKSPITPQPKW